MSLYNIIIPVFAKGQARIKQQERLNPVLAWHASPSTHRREVWLHLHLYFALDLTWGISLAAPINCMCANCVQDAYEST